MIWTVVLLAQSAAPAIAHDALVVERGAELYRMNCAVPFCHGAEGAAGRAPALAGRNFEPAALRRSIAHGIPNRGMPAFQKQLGDDGVNAVLAYVRTLRSPEPARANGNKATPVKLPKEAVAGRELFFDSARLPGCSDCHIAANMGATVATRLTSIASVEALRGVRATQVWTAQVAGEPPEFPAVLAEVTAETTRLYDLSSPLPVLRTLPKSQVTLKEGSTWSHASVVGRYTQRELELILTFIRAIQ